MEEENDENSQTDPEEENVEDFDSDEPDAIIEYIPIPDKPEEVISQPSYAKDIFIMTFATFSLLFLVYCLLSGLGFLDRRNVVVLAKGAPKPFFSQFQRDLIDDSYDGSLRISKNPRISLQMFYSPYSFNSKNARRMYHRTAMEMRRQHPHTFPYFGAVNCFDIRSACRRKFKLKRYPMMMATTHQQISSVYNGPMNHVYVTRWLNRLQNAVYRITEASDLVELAKQFDAIVILYHPFNKITTISESFKNYTSAAIEYQDGDPNSESAIFCVVTDSNIASQYQIYEKNDVAIVNSELKQVALLSSADWNQNLQGNVRFYSRKEQLKTVEVLNAGLNRFSSNQLAKKINDGAVFLLMAKNIYYGSSKHTMLRNIAKEYHDCAEDNILSLVPEINETVEENCTISVKGYSCGKNSTLTFMIADSAYETQLATKFGAEHEDLIIAINAEQENTRFIRGNVTKEMIHCLIRQHHNTAENRFVVESSRVVVQTPDVTIADDDDADPIGVGHYVKHARNLTEVMSIEKNAVVLFSGGVWHSASMAAIASFYQTSALFSDFKQGLQFFIVDVTKTQIPYNLDFEKLPKILITGSQNVGNSWSYPEDFPINYTNLIRFIISRPSLQFQILSKYLYCDETCRNTSKKVLTAERNELKRMIGRHVSNSRSKRKQLGNIDRVLNMFT